MQGALIVLKIQGHNFTYLNWIELSQIEWNLSRPHFYLGEIIFNLSQTQI